MDHESEWSQVEDAFVEIEGESIPVPVMVIEHPLVADTNTINQFLRSLKGPEIEAGYRFYTDRWTWDTGHPSDRYFANIYETEHKRRKELTKSIDRIWLKNGIQRSVQKVIALIQSGSVTANDIRRWKDDSNDD